MPALSSTMTEGKIVSWLKNEGDKITKGESVVVVESDKADMDVESCKWHALICLKRVAAPAHNKFRSDKIHSITSFYCC